MFKNKSIKKNVSGVCRKFFNASVPVFMCAITIKTGICSLNNNIYIDMKQDVLDKSHMGEMYSVTGDCTWLQLRWLQHWWSQVLEEFRRLLMGFVITKRAANPLIFECVCGGGIAVISVPQHLTFEVCCTWHKQNNKCGGLWMVSQEAHGNYRLSTFIQGNAYDMSNLKLQNLRVCGPVSFYKFYIIQIS